MKHLRDTYPKFNENTHIIELTIHIRQIIQ
jgi:hypothetical protein